MFNNKMLIQISGIGSTTFYKKLKALKIKKPSGYFGEAKAKEISKKMGFEISFEKYLSKKFENTLSKESVRLFKNR